MEQIGMLACYGAAAWAALRTTGAKRWRACAGFIVLAAVLDLVRSIWSDW